MVKREIRIGTQDRKASLSVKKAQTWKYPKGVVQRASSVIINGRFYSDNKADYDDPSANQSKQGAEEESAEGAPRRKQESNFLITLNPNRQFPDAQKAEARKRFEHALMRLAENGELVKCIVFGPVSAYFQNDRAMDVILPGIQWDAAVEEGDQLKRMHCHIWVTIHHFSQIQINHAVMRELFNRHFNAYPQATTNIAPLVKLPYCQVKLLPQSDWTTVMKQYILKGMQSSSASSS